MSSFWTALSALAPLSTAKADSNSFALRVKSSCGYLFSSKEMKTLVALKDATVGTSGHSLTIVENRGYLKIGILRMRERRFSMELMKAIEGDVLAEIDADVVVGPKVLPVLVNLKKIVPPKSTLSIKGSFTPSAVIEWMETQRAMQDSVGTTIDSGGRNPFFFTDSDVASFYDSVKELKVEKACRDFYGVELSKCGELLFRFQANQPEGITWQLPSP